MVTNIRKPTLGEEETLVVENVGGVRFRVLCWLKGASLQVQTQRRLIPLDRS